MSRREFVGRAAVAGGVAAMPASAWARAAGANERLRVGVIGCGTQGGLHLRNLVRRAEASDVVVHRVCDVFQARLTEAMRACGLGTESATMEYRDVLDDPDIDAVIVATPDHWQARIAMDALSAGKSVLVETPFAHTIEQAIALRERAAQSSRVLAVGARSCSDARYREIHSMVLRSKLGRVTMSQAGFSVNPRVPLFNRRWVRQVSLVPGSPDHLWWDRWQGHGEGLAPRHAFEGERFFQFPKFYDYSGGLLTEFLFDKLAGLLYATGGRRGEQPTRVCCGGGLYNLFDGRDVPDQVFATFDFATEHSIVLMASACTETHWETLVCGRHATVRVNDAGLGVSEQSDFYPEFRNINRHSLDAGMVRNERGQWIPDPPRGEAAYQTELDPGSDVLGNFLDCVRGEAEPNCGAELGCAAAIGIRLAVDAYRERAVKLWDPKTESPPEG